MSADNQMVVAPHGDGWCTYMQFGDRSLSETERHGVFFKTFATRNEAINYAAKVCEQEIVEYGIRIEKKQESRYQAKMYWMNWWVFDTASKLPNGERRAICMCTTEHEAKFICNALNTKENN